MLEFWYFWPKWDNFGTHARVPRQGTSDKLKVKEGNEKQEKKITLYLRERFKLLFHV